MLIKMIKKKLENIKNFFRSLKKLKVLVVGDSIIDEYVFALPKGRAIKDPILSTEYRGKEVYAGGALAISNHLSGFVKEVRLVTLVGDRKTNGRINGICVKRMVKDNVFVKCFVKTGAYTSVKRRFISPYRFEKLFKMEYMSDKPISKMLSDEVIKYLSRVIPDYDLVLVADFGHGFINQAIREKIREKAKYMSVNCQSNSSNMGYNYITNYLNSKPLLKPFFVPDFMSMTEEEARMPLYMRFENIEDVIKILGKKYFLKNFIVTLGKKGSIYYHKGKIFPCKAFVEKPKDTMGAGDALYAITTLMDYIGANPVLIPFLGNIAGGIISNSIGNKESINPKKILEFVKEVKK